MAAESAEDVAVGSTATQEKFEAARAAVIAEEEEDEPTIPGGEVQVLTEENFERLTQVATGATTGDWFIGESLTCFRRCCFLCYVSHVSALFMCLLRFIF